MITQKYLTLEDVAEYLNYSKSHVNKNWRGWAANGLRYFQLGKRPRFRTKDVDAFMDKNKAVTF